MVFINNYEKDTLLLISYNVYYVKLTLQKIKYIQHYQNKSDGIY